MSLTRRQLPFHQEYVCGAFLLALLLGAGLQKAVAAESPQTLSPFIQSIFPRSARQGTEVESVIQGKYLGGAYEVRFSGTGVPPAYSRPEAAHHFQCPGPDEGQVRSNRTAIDPVIGSVVCP